MVDQISEPDFQTQLHDLFANESELQNSGSDDAAPVFETAIRDVRTFDEAMLLTTDQGIVVTLDNGQRFALTIQLMGR